MGGFPWWLLKQEDIQLRTRDPHYLDAARHYLKEVGRVLGPLQISKGGPILMVQVENEYGFFGKDTAYMGDLRQALLDAGFEVPLFACNPPQQLKNGFRNDLFQVVNFGSDPANGFKALREVLPKGPLMCGEFYPGLVRYVGRAASHRQHIALPGRPRIHAQSRWLVQHLHGPWRNHVWLLDRCGPPV
jgi:beta-galactosidase